MIKGILTNQYFLLALTFGIYQGCKMLQRKTGSILLNPILLAIGLIILFLTACHIPYDTYHESAKLIDFWLKPAVVALGVPLYLQLSQIKKEIVPILASQMMGCLGRTVELELDDIDKVGALHHTVNTPLTRLLLRHRAVEGQHTDDEVEGVLEITLTLHRVLLALETVGDGGE